jgi:hypothetical protein
MSPLGLLLIDHAPRALGLHRTYLLGNSPLGESVLVSFSGLALAG